MNLISRAVAKKGEDRGGGKEALEVGYVLLVGSQGPYMLKTRRDQSVLIEKLRQENIGLPHSRHHSILICQKSESIWSFSRFHWG